MNGQTIWGRVNPVLCCARNTVAWRTAFWTFVTKATWIVHTALIMLDLHNTVFRQMMWMSIELSKFLNNTRVVAKNSICSCSLTNEYKFFFHQHFTKTKIVNYFPYLRVIKHVIRKMNIFTLKWLEAKSRTNTFDKLNHYTCSINHTVFVFCFNWMHSRYEQSVC